MSKLRKAYFRSIAGILAVTRAGKVLSILGDARYLNAPSWLVPVLNNRTILAVATALEAVVLWFLVKPHAVLVRSVAVQFTPHLAPLNRGILTTLYLTLSEAAGQPSRLRTAAGKAGKPRDKRGVPNRQLPWAAEQLAQLDQQIAACFRAAYAAEPFVRLLSGKALPDTKNVAGTNVIEIAWRLDPRTGRLVVMSALDNLIKGASGQAIQSLNLLAGFPETAGLL